MRSFLLGFDSKFSSFEMTRLTQNKKTAIVTATATVVLHRPKGKWGTALVAGDLRSGFLSPIAKRNDNVNQSTIQMKWKIVFDKRV
jgi:hypothetical protein